MSMLADQTFLYERDPIIALVKVKFLMKDHPKNSDNPGLQNKTKRESVDLLYLKGLYVHRMNTKFVVGEDGVSYVLSIISEYLNLVHDESIVFFFRYIHVVPRISTCK